MILNTEHDFVMSFPDEESCKKYLIDIIHEGNVECPYCRHYKSYNIEKKHRYKCANSKCFKKFTLTTGTLIHASNIPLLKMFFIVWACISKDTNSYALTRLTDLTQKTTWFRKSRLSKLLNGISREDKTAYDLFRSAITVIFKNENKRYNTYPVRQDKELYSTECNKAPV